MHARYPLARHNFSDIYTALTFVRPPNSNYGVLKLFGQEVNLFKLRCMPAQVIVDMKGIARYVHYSKSMNDIPWRCKNVLEAGLFESVEGR